MQLPLVLFNQPIGQRNYFDCYESALGGLIAAEINNYELTQNLYSLIDCFVLINDEKERVFLQPKAVDVNELITLIFGLEIASCSIDEIIACKKNFVLSYDEYYAKENYHYRKKHFNHASLGLEIISKLNFKIIDPGLEITKPVGYSADERTISFDNEIFEDQNKLLIFTMKSKNDSVNNYDDKRWQNSIIAKLEELNAALWSNKAEIRIDNKNFFYGIKALEKFSESLTEFSNVETAANEFYKWIFPLYWKNDYIKRNNSVADNKLIILLENIIKEMEILETNLLRLKANYKSSLHNSAIKRWDNISSMIRQYIQVELP